jgi:hypothetical protein
MEEDSKQPIDDSVDSDDQQFHTHQQSKQDPLTTNHRTQTQILRHTPMTIFVLALDNILPHFMLLTIYKDIQNDEKLIIRFNEKQFTAVILSSVVEFIFYKIMH